MEGGDVTDDDLTELPEPVLIAGPVMNAHDFARRYGVRRWRSADCPGALLGFTGGTLVLVAGYDPSRRDLFDRATLQGMRIVAAAGPG